ncbi:hypothetical protein C8Q73DRAFT_19337 [Cubamyces lactineus]|nr:hypothetical protein C8Q73DRAFT_19337 [Cubamyces lactineus]
MAVHLPCIPPDIRRSCQRGLHGVMSFGRCRALRIREWGRVRCTPCLQKAFHESGSSTIRRSSRMRTRCSVPRDSVQNSRGDVAPWCSSRRAPQIALAPRRAMWIPGSSSRAWGRKLPLIARSLRVQAGRCSSPRGVHSRSRFFGAGSANFGCFELRTVLWVIGAPDFLQDSRPDPFKPSTYKFAREMPPPQGHTSHPLPLLDIHSRHPHAHSPTSVQNAPNLLRMVD